MASELEKHIATWLLRVKSQTREGKDRVTGKALGDMARMLAADFSREAFTPESMHAVALAAPDGWFPSAYAVMNRLVGDWWRDNKPPSADSNWPPGIDRLASVADRGWFRLYWTQRPAALAADNSRVRALGEFTTPPYRDRYAPATDIAYSRVERLNALLRRQSAAAWALIRGPKEIEGEPDPIEPPAADPLAVQRAISSAAAAMQPRGMFDPVPSHSLDEQREAVGGFAAIPPLRSRALTAEQLAAARATVRGGVAP